MYLLLAVIQQIGFEFCIHSTLTDFISHSTCIPYILTFCEVNTSAKRQKRDTLQAICSEDTILSDKRNISGISRRIFL